MSRYELLLRQITSVGAIALIGGSIGAVVLKETDWAILLFLAAWFGLIAFLFGLLTLVAHYYYEDENKNNKQDKDRK